MRLKKTSFCGSTSDQVDSHDPRLRISFVGRQHTEHSLTHSYTDQWSSAACTKVVFCENFGFRCGVVLGFCAASLGNLLLIRCPETSITNYPLTLQKISQKIETLRFLIPSPVCSIHVFKTLHTSFVKCHTRQIISAA